MLEIDKRLASLSPEQRQKLAAILRKKGAAATPEATVAVQDEQLVLDASQPGEPDTLKAAYKRFYDGVSSQLNGSMFGQFSFFLNYGYKSNGAPECSAVELPDQYLNRNSVKLVLEVIGDCAVREKRVLDVGCGRGGTVHVFQTFVRPSLIAGVDLSSEAIGFCRGAHKKPNTTFYEGDAERLPFEDQSFDIVTNLESSHSYPHINLFYSEVYRVLAPGGHFLYTDALGVQQFQSCIAYLAHIGFKVLRDRDITQNVLLSCDEVAQTRVAAFDSRNDRQLMNDFLATPGSNVYAEMQSGRWTYRILKLRKDG